MKPDIKFLPVSAALALSWICFYVGSLWLSRDNFFSAEFLSPPTLEALYRLGGSSAVAVRDNREWSRLLTAPFLHADILHLATNIVGLLFITSFLEPFIGAALLFVVFSVSAAVGALLSCLIHDASVVGIGASGGVLGLLAASLALLSRVHGRSARSLLWSRYFPALAIQLVPAVLDLISRLFPVFASNESHIDHMAHLGGLLVGGLMGLLLLRLWPPFELRPLYPKLWLTGAWLILICLLVSEVRVLVL